MSCFEPVGESAPERRATIGEGGQRRVLGSPDSVEGAAAQHFDVRAGFGDV